MKVPPDPERCTFEFTDGRRCRGWRMTPDPTCLLCESHHFAEKRRQEAAARKAEQAQAQSAAPEGSFANALPDAAEEFLAKARDTMSGSAAGINVLMEQVLQMVVGNAMSARSATACAQLFRLMLKAQPQVEEEEILLNQMWELQRQQERAAQAAHGEPAGAEDSATTGELANVAPAEAAKSRAAAAD